MIMLNVNKISRQQWIAAIFILGCGVIGALSGRQVLLRGLAEKQLENEQKQIQSDPAFVMPVAPPDRMSAEEKLSPKDTAQAVIDLNELRIWEAAVRQPLPPRKTALTPARWRIVGVTSVGNEKSVLLLFENQPATETRKIGEKLPGGAKIVEIAQDQLKISLNGQLMKLNLRKQ